MEKVKLHELVDIYLGVTHTPDYIFEGVPFLSVKDISGGKICFEDCKYISQKEYDSLSEGAKPKVGDMLFCRVGTIGKPIIIPEGTPLFGSFVSLGYLRNRNSDRCDLNYLKYWMYSRSFWKQVDANVKGASQVNLNTGWLSKFDIDLPGIEEQRYRISVLDKCKSVIEKRKDELSILDDLIRARFVEMFGDPVSDSKNWGQVPLKEHLESIRYGISTPPIFTDDGYAFIRATNIKNGKIVVNDMKYIPQEEADRLEKCKLSGGEIIIVRSGVNAGDTCVVTDEYIGQYAGYDMILVLNNNLHPVFFNTLINTEYMDKIVKPLTRRAAQPHLNSEQTQGLPIIQVPFELQEQFADFVKQVDKSKVILPKLSFNVII